MVSKCDEKLKAVGRPEVTIKKSSKARIEQVSRVQEQKHTSRRGKGVNGVSFVAKRFLF